MKHNLSSPETDPRRDEQWEQRLITNSNGNPAACLANAIVALTYAPEWQGVLHFDESNLEVVARSTPPWESRAIPFVWRDDDDVRGAAWMQRQGIMVGHESMGQAVQAVARENGFHPVRNYLDSLRWDGIRRLDDWLVRYLGVDPTDYVQAVGAKWLIGAVARVYRPGCKNDTCLILEGPQGGLKSTALRTLAGHEFFADDISEFGSKDSVLQMRGVWIIELAELDAMRKSESARIKAFMSRQVDRIRLPYGRRVIEAPRECVFAGTVNHEAYLKDETGGRRFWPVKCGQIAVQDLARDRDPLWAEARDRFHAGSIWWLDSMEINAAAEIEQRSRYDADPWQHPIEEWTDGRTSVTVEQVLEECLGKPKNDWLQFDKTRISRCLKALGWVRYQKRLEDGTRVWQYRRSGG